MRIDIHGRRARSRLRSYTRRCATRLYLLFDRFVSFGFTIVIELLQHTLWQVVLEPVRGNFYIIK